jgi:hypothetical protein
MAGVERLRIVTGGKDSMGKSKGAARQEYTLDASMWPILLGALARLLG